MSVEESNEFDELMEIVNEDEQSEPAGEKSEEEQELEIPLTGKAGGKGG
ncbi:hypothetical protein G9409_07530 [Chlorobium sp. BLA1]|nr:hypothetical protein [Candidatus Chlorobium masyuteum]NHQ60440.1 hypothetical protein [Candidatus Chlorobium masyuteum]